MVDKHGSIHVMDDDERKRLLEELNGPRVEIPLAELDEVRAMNREQRRQWYRDRKSVAEKKTP